MSSHHSAKQSHSADIMHKQCAKQQFLEDVSVYL